MTASVRLAIDFGTSHTVAILDPGTGTGQPLLFGDSPLLPSAVHAFEPGQILTGRDAIRAARTAPELFEPNPKRRVDDGSILLGSEEYPVTTLIAAVLKTVAAEAHRVAGRAPDAVALTHPASWGSARLNILLKAVAEAGLGRARLVPEPQAAADFFTKSERRGARPGTVVVYDFGGGTFDVCVLTLADTGYQVQAQAGLDDVGGADLDASLLTHLGQTASGVDAAVWDRIVQPSDPQTRRAFRALYEDVKDTKEQLSRNSSGLVHIPLMDRDFPVTREEFERIARPLVTDTVDLTVNTLARLGISPGHPLSLYLVGGSSRVPLVSTLLHRRLRQAPVITGQPEQVVAQGALLSLRVSKPDSARALPIVKTAPAAGLPPTRKDHAAPIPAPPRAAASVPASPAKPPAPRIPAPRRAPEPPAPSAPPPLRPAPAPPRKSRAPLYLSILAVLLLALGAGGWYLTTLDDDPGSTDDTSTTQDGAADGNTSDEPDPNGFDECVYFDSTEEPTLVSAECGGGSASHGVTRTVDDASGCDDAVEELYGYFGDRDGIFCVTELFELDTCLNEDFNTTPCADPSLAPYEIKDGPLEPDTCRDKDFETSVKLDATGEYFCLGPNNR